MSTDIAQILAEIGGNELIDSWDSDYKSTSGIAFPTSQSDGISIGYAIALGALASVADQVLDQAFRSRMHQRHDRQNIDVEEALEAPGFEALAEDGYNVLGREKSSPRTLIDHYRHMSELLKLRDGFKLSPKNHRVYNHVDREAVIDKLVTGDARHSYAPMSRKAAEILWDSHMAADRVTKQSLPLKFMAYLWEQNAKEDFLAAGGSAEEVGELGKAYVLLKKMCPDLDWPKWINRFYGDDNLMPEGASLGECMLKLYETGMLNERVFWTSDFGAGVGGFKRRLVITGLMEIGVELFAFLEGVKKGHVDFTCDPADMAKQYLAWRDQPKYLDMKILAQSMACGGGFTRALVKGDPFCQWPLILTHFWPIKLTHL
uniref:hypothetical protein n=1 Tax=uncultured Halopseudomonas sp. TaxID=2901193 RepID=UPI0030ED549A